jgi:hypothetical protein
MLGASTAAAAGAAETDAQALASALGVEQLLIVAYRQVVAAPVLSPAARSELRVLLGQEEQHVAALERGLAGLGARPTNALPSLAVAQAQLNRHHVPWRLTRLRTERACLKLLIDAESVAEDAYFSAIAQLQDPALIRTCAAIMGSEAQHWTVLSAILNNGDVSKAVPYPFVGSPLKTRG